MFIHTGYQLLIQLQKKVTGTASDFIKASIGSAMLTQLTVPTVSIFMLLVFLSSALRCVADDYCHGHFCMRLRGATLHENMRLVGSVWSLRRTVSSEQSCVDMCLLHCLCVSVNVKKNSNLCEINTEDAETSQPDNLIADRQYDHIELQMNIVKKVLVV